MKYELKIEFKDNQQLEKVIQKSYFEDGTLGKLIGKKDYITIGSEDPLFIIFRGLNNITVKILNEEMIDGSIIERALRILSRWRSWGAPSAGIFNSVKT